MPADERKEAEVFVSCLLVTFEMVLLASLTNFSYSYKDYIKDSKKYKKEWNIKDKILN